VKRLLIYLVLAVQVVGLVGLYAWHANVPQTQYLLRTRPVDPRDLLRGDYMTLGYEISTPPVGTHPPAGVSNAPVFVRLRPDGRFWVADAVADAPRNDGAPWVRAHWKRGRLDYGIDRYFVPEGKGNPPGRITVEIVIRKSGEPQIVQLYSDDRPWP